MEESSVNVIRMYALNHRKTQSRAYLYRFSDDIFENSMPLRRDKGHLGHISQMLTTKNRNRTTYPGNRTTKNRCSTADNRYYQEQF